MTLQELCEKDVIQLQSGENLGRIDDVIFDEKTASLQAVVLRGRGHLFGLLGYDEDLVIPWAALQTIGTDVIMVAADPLPAHSEGKRYNFCKR